MTNLEKTVQNENDDLLYKLLRECATVQCEDNYFEYIDHEFLCYLPKMSPIFVFDDDKPVEENGRISLAYENLGHIPRKIAEKFSSQIKILDLSYNKFSNLSFLALFKDLHTLILDRNDNLDEGTFPYLQHLEILWMNNCNIKNVHKWIYKIKMHCPKIRHLSFMGNPGAKNLLSGANYLEDSNYRMFVVSVLPNLEYLDDSPVSQPPKSLQVIQSPTTRPISTNSPPSSERENVRTSFRDLFRFNGRKRKSYKTF